eukprot:7750384-Pyramimonas_sp.AAC.1
MWGGVHVSTRHSPVPCGRQHGSSERTGNPSARDGGAGRRTTRKEKSSRRMAVCALLGEAVGEHRVTPNVRLVIIITSMFVVIRLVIIITSMFVVIRLVSMLVASIVSIWIRIRYCRFDVASIDWR